MLEKSNNPFASVILAQLEALNIKNKSMEQKKQVKFSLTKRLYEKGFDKKSIIDLYKFIDWLICLPKSLEIEYIHQIRKLEELTQMPYISSAERLGMEKGIEKGIEKGMEKGIKKGIEQVAINMLEEGAKISFIKKTTGLSLSKIKKLQQHLNVKK